MLKQTDQIDSFLRLQSNEKVITNFVSYLKEKGLYPDFQVLQTAGTLPEVKIKNNNYYMFCSNNYLGLATDEAVISAAEKQFKKHGAGPGGSRLLCGNIDILDELDNKVAEFVGKQDAITFPTGYMANLAVFSALMDPFFDDLPFPKGSGVIFSDEYNHATVVDGCRLSSSKKEVFKHNNPADLEAKLKEYSGNQNKLIVSEGAFSLEGHFGKLNEIVQLAKQYNSLLMVDDAHGIGVVGKEGRGTVDHFKLNDKVDIIMGSFDKGLGSTGGFLAGDSDLIEFLRTSARPYIFSSAVPAVLAASVIESIKICTSKRGQQLRKKLFDNANYLRTNIKALGFKILGNGTLPVVPVFIGDENEAIRISNKLFKNGIYVPCFRWPAVPRGTSRIRLSIMASHEKEHLDRLLNIFEDYQNN